MDPASLISLTQQALLLTLSVALPILAVAAIVGFVMAVLQAATQVQDPTLSHLPRFVAVAGALVVLGPWIGRQIASFAARLLAGM